MFMRRTAARFGWLCALMLTGWPAPSHAQTPDDAGDCTGAPCPLIAIDTLLYVENRGVTRFFIDLNDHRFKLATDPDEVRQSRNAFLIPRQGAITVHIGAYLAPDDENPFDDTCEADVPASGNNCIRITPQGSTDAGTGADVIIADLLLPGQTVAYRVEGLTEIPADFDLVGGAPNPVLDRDRHRLPHRREPHDRLAHYARPLRRGGPARAHPRRRAAVPGPVRGGLGRHRRRRRPGGERAVLLPHDRRGRARDRLGRARSLASVD